MPCTCSGLAARLALLEVAVLPAPRHRPAPEGCWYCGRSGVGPFQSQLFKVQPKPPHSPPLPGRGPPTLCPPIDSLVYLCSVSLWDPPLHTHLYSEFQALAGYAVHLRGHESESSWACRTPRSSRHPSPPSSQCSVPLSSGTLQCCPQLLSG